MDLRTKLALVTLEGPLLDWMEEWGDDHPDLADDVADVLDRIDAVRRDAMIAEAVEIELSKMRHPASTASKTQGENTMTWFAEPYIAENVAWELEATTKEDAIREAEEIRSEIDIKYHIYEEH